MKYRFDDLTDAEVNLIGTSLAKQPFEHVSALIMKLQRQCAEQVKAAARPEKPEKQPRGRPRLVKADPQPAEAANEAAKG